MTINIIGSPTFQVRRPRPWGTGTRWRPQDRRWVCGTPMVGLASLGHAGTAPQATCPRTSPAHSSPPPSPFPKAPCLGEGSVPAGSGMWQLTLGPSWVRQIRQPLPPTSCPSCLPPLDQRLWTPRAWLSPAVEEELGCWGAASRSPSMSELRPALVLLASSAQGLQQGQRPASQQLTAPIR